MKTRKLITVAVLVVLGTSAVRAAPEDLVYFEDNSLKISVEYWLGIDDPNEADMLQLTTLPAGQWGVVRSLVGLEYATNLKELYLSGNRITDISPLTGLMNLEYLNMGNNQISDISQFAEMTMLSRLDLSHNQISDISPLHGLMNLKRLELDHNPITDISPLDGMTNLEMLRLRNNQVTQVSLSDLPNLLSLELGWNQIMQTTLSGSGLPNLTNLELRYNQISDVSGLDGLTSLGRLLLDANPLSDISPLGSLTNIYELWLNENQITDISPLSGLINLADLRAANNTIKDVSPLADLTSLYWLDLRANQISDISPLAGLMNLQLLLLSENQITDISPLAGLSQLIGLRLESNQITDISPLAGLTQLIGLRLQSNQISDISGLAGLTTLEYLNLSDNYVSDIRPLVGLTNLGYLYLNSNIISDIQPLVDNPGIDGVYQWEDTVELNCNPLSDKAITTDIPILLARGVIVTFDENAECADTDGDGLLDKWETNGIDIDGDGTPELDLAALGANPLHKDLFVEVDAMVGRAPSEEAIYMVIDAFAKAPNNLLTPPNPDGDDGINLHIQLYETDIPCYDWPGPGFKAWDDFDAIKNNDSPYIAGGLGTRDDRMDAENWPKIKAARKLAFRYCIFANRFLDKCPDGDLTWRSSGFAEWTGDDFAVTLGDAYWQEDPKVQERITEIQAGTFMHELGHNLGLHHGGSKAIGEEQCKISYKPNYFSVMNYHWQFPRPDYRYGPDNRPWEPDYSREALPTINESHLNETVGVMDAAGVRFPVGPPPRKFINANEPNDWNRNGDPCEVDVSADINYLKDYFDIDNYCCPPPSPGDVFLGHCDWPVLWYRLAGDPKFKDGVHGADIEPEMTYDEYIALFETITEGINASVDFDPDVLNLASRAKVVTVYIELQGEFDVSDIDISTLKLNDSVAPLSKPVQIGDYDIDGIPDLMVKFDCAQVAQVLGTGQQVVTIMGRLGDGTQFAGTDSVRVINVKGVIAADAEFQPVVVQESRALKQKKPVSAETDEADIGASEIFDVKESVAFMLLEACQTIGELGPENFNNEEAAIELIDTIDAMFGMLDDGLYFEALVVLDNDILQRIDGCANMGEPDEDDWIRSIDGQALVYPLVVETMELLERLI